MIPLATARRKIGLINDLRACADVHVVLRDAEAALKERPADTLLMAVHVPVRRAAIELRSNQPGKAIDLLQTAAPFERSYPEVVYLRGVAYLAAGRSADAITEFQKVIDHQGAYWGPRYPLAHLGLARAAVRAGDLDRGRKAYQDFLALWRSADPDIPLLIDAKKEYAALN